MPDKLVYIFITGYYVLFYILIALGTILTVRNRNWLALIIGLLIPIWFLYLPGIAGNARFRAPVEGLLTLIAAVAIIWIGERLRRPEKIASTLS